MRFAGCSADPETICVVASLATGGALLSAFFWTYALLQLFGAAGWLSDRFPVGWVMVGGYLLWSAATIATGLVTGFFYAVRGAIAALGAGESVAYPCYSRVFAGLLRRNTVDWLRTRWIDVGTKLGPAIPGAFVGGLLLVHVGWRMLFVVIGIGGLLWVLPWIKLMPRVGRRQSRG